MEKNRLGLEATWECPACGNILKTQSPFWTKKLRKDVCEPTRCPCGRKSSFKLVGFKQCEFKIVGEKEDE